MASLGGQKQKYWVGMTREEFEQVCAIRDASAMFRQAVRWGIVIRQPCVVCGARKAGGHHYDYRRPLDVIWLCSLHHIHEHMRLGAGHNTNMAFGNIGISIELQAIISGENR